MIGAQHCQATPRTLFPPWWGYRAGTCAVPNPTKFFARSAGRGVSRAPSMAASRYWLPGVRPSTPRPRRQRCPTGRHVKPPWAAFERRIQPGTPHGDSRTASGALPAPNRSC